MQVAHWNERNPGLPMADKDDPHPEFPGGSRDAHSNLATACALAVVDRLHYGILFLGHKGAVHWSNRAASMILAAHDGLSLEGNRLRASTSESSARLHDEIEAAHGRAAAGRSEDAVLMLDRPTGRRRLALLIAPHTGGGLPNESVAVVVYVIDPELAPPAPAETLLAMYGLTKGETQLLLVLVDGLSTREAAEHLGIGYDTARTRLSTIFDKTGTRRQPDLLRLVLLSTPPRVRL